MSARAPRPKAIYWSKTSPAPPRKAGVRPGDVILGVNGKPVKSIAELKNATASASKNVAILIEREGQPLYVAIRIS